MRKSLLLAAIAVLLSSCSTYAPGDDPKGIQLQSVASQVLTAVRTYMDENARPPRTLKDLVPKYLPAIPDEPLINYDPKGMRLDFLYTQEGKTGSQVACHAVIGETDWICTGIYQQRQ